MHKKLKKQPTAEFSPDEKKIPRVEKSAENTKFTWSFALLDKDGPFGWSRCATTEKYLEILSKKGAFEEMDITELYYRKCHSVEVSKLCNDAQKRLVEIKRDDLSSLFSFRLNGPNRVWCIKQGSVMRVLWWDPDHLVCPSLLKNT